MAFRLRNLAIIALFSLISPLSFSQELEEGYIKCDFRVFALDRQDIEGVYFADGEANVPLSFKRKRRSDMFSYEGPEKIQFFELEKNEAGENIRVPVGSVDLSRSIKEPLLFFLENPNQSDLKYSITAIDDSQSAFPYGSLLIFNASGAKLEGKVGDEELELGYGPTSPMNMDRLRAKRNEPWVNMFFITKIGEDYELVYRNRVLFRDDGRSILVLRPPRRARSIKIYTYLLEEFRPSEYVPADEYQSSGA